MCIKVDTKTLAERLILDAISCRELLPKLPADGIFAIDNSLRKGSGSVCNDAVVWQWQDDRGTWHSYTPIDSKIIEVGFLRFDTCKTIVCDLFL